MTGDNNNGWGEYSRMVLKELETLARGIDSLRVEIQGLKQELAELKAKEDKVKPARASTRSGCIGREVERGGR